ncbi:hypothetical protein [Corynebacterium hiratae]|uniref:hypothetical protein n=1 Tax=Corynebacterium hiratae TaxID=3139423 RepID=UPI00272E66F2|nr:hypothetical protein [Corynebacterium aurimucosum]
MANVEEGPLVVQFDVRQMDGQDTFNVNVPGGSGSVSLRELLADQYEYTPVVISEARRILAESKSLLSQAQTARAGIGGDVEKALTRVQQRTTTIVEEAKGQLDGVVKSVKSDAESAGKSAQSAGSAATIAKQHLDGANTALKSAQGIQTKVGEILGEVQSLKEEASTSSTSAAGSAGEAKKSQEAAKSSEAAAGKDAQAAKESAADANKYLSEMKTVAERRAGKLMCSTLTARQALRCRGRKARPASRVRRVRLVSPVNRVRRVIRGQLDHRVNLASKVDLVRLVRKARLARQELSCPRKSRRIRTWCGLTRLAA